MVRDILPLPPSALYVYVLLESPVKTFMPGCGSRVVALERESPSGDDEVHFALSQGGVDLSGFLPQATGDSTPSLLRRSTLGPPETYTAFSSEAVRMTSRACSATTQDSDGTTSDSLGRARSIDRELVATGRHQNCGPWRAPVTLSPTTANGRLPLPLHPRPRENGY